MNNFRPEQYTYMKNSWIPESTLMGAIESGDILEATAIRCNADLSLTIDLGRNLIGTIPFEEFEYNISNKPLKNIAIVSKVGKHVMFRVMSYEKKEDGNTYFQLSRKEAQKRCYEEFISKLQVGQVINAYAHHVESYGVFCDIGCGIVALLPIENICTTRIKNPKKELASLSRLKVIVKAIGDDGRIVLSHKEILGTWNEEVKNYQVGTTVTGIARIIEPYGVFVQLTPNLVGLADPFSGVKPGDSVSVFIKSIIPEKMKVKLSIINVLNEANTRTKIHFNYKIPEGNVVKHWKYSPDECDKVIETTF